MLRSKALRFSFGAKYETVTMMKAIPRMYRYRLGMLLTVKKGKET